MQQKYNHKVYSMRLVDFMVEFRTSHHEEFCRRYNIILNEDGSVYDLDLKRTFSCMYNWASEIKETAYVQHL
jgi:hypothetical protein